MQTATTQTPSQPTARQATYTVAEAAQRLGTTKYQLFAWLRDHQYVFINREGINLPYPQYVARGYFVTHTSSYRRGHVLCNAASTHITATGIAWLAKKLKEPPCPPNTPA